MIVDIDALLDGGETYTVEFKRGSISDSELVEAVACLANGDGGVLLLGVEDDGSVSGVLPRHGALTDPAQVAGLVQNKTEPAHPVDVKVVPRSGGDIVVIEVPRAQPGPIATKKGLFVRRALNSKGRPECRPMTPHEVVSLGLVTRGIDYAATPARGASFDDLDPQEFDRFRRLCSRSGDAEMARLSDRDIASALGVVGPDEVLGLGAVLLFGTLPAVQRWLPTAEVLFQDTRVDSSVNLRFVAPLLFAAEEIARHLDLRNTSTELMSGLLRVDVPLLAEQTRRESVANALVHRDYAEVGPTAVRLSPTHFSVNSPGGFPPGITVSNLLEQSRPRSPILADAFRRAGLVERRGKGVNEMFESQLRAGREAPDYTGSTTSSVDVSVPLGTADLDLVRFLVAFENDHQHSLDLEELRVLHDVKAQGSATNGELSDSLRRTVASVRATTTRLLERGVLEARGGGRNRRVHLTARFYDLAQDRSAYVRVRGMDPLQQEQMVLGYVRSYGSITRAQAADLCQVTPVEARRLLKGLTDRAVLSLVGERRTSRYELPS